jgi:hypothetical protein
LEEIKEDKVEIPKDNIVEIEEKQEEKQIVIDEASGETIPPLVVHQAPGIYTEHHQIDEPTKKLEPKYDYEEEFAFKEKQEKSKNEKQVRLDGGDF